MTAPSPEVEILRARAAGLRKLAGRLQASPVVDLHRRAGTDVWLGPTAFECHDELITLGRRITDAADDLVWSARSLEQQAAVLAAMTAVPG